MNCSCGNTELHIVANRQTLDGIGVAMWSDGALTGCLGARLLDVPVSRPKTAEAQKLTVRTGRLFLGEVCLYASNDLGALYKACRWTAERDGLPGTVRSRLIAMTAPRFSTSWIVVETDRDGTVKKRYWRLPRLLMAGTVVWDTVNQNNRYEICYTLPDSQGRPFPQTITPSGIKFQTLPEVFQFIHEGLIRQHSAASKEAHDSRTAESPENR